jgi:hypothetical protein
MGAVQTFFVRFRVDRRGCDCNGGKKPGGERSERAQENEEQHYKELNQSLCELYLKANVDVCCTLEVAKQ